MKPPIEYRRVKCQTCGGDGHNKAFNPAWIGWARSRARKSYRELGEYVGMSASFLHDVEHGRRVAPARLVARLKRLLANQERAKANGGRSA